MKPRHLLLLATCFASACGYARTPPGEGSCQFDTQGITGEVIAMIHFTGGFAGLDERHLIYDDGTVETTSGAGAPETSVVPGGAARAATLASDLRASGVYELEPGCYDDGGMEEYDAISTSVVLGGDGGLLRLVGRGPQALARAIDLLGAYLGEAGAR